MTTTKPYRSPTVPPPPAIDPPPYDDGGGDLLPLHSFTHIMGIYGSVLFVARLVEKWTGRGCRTPCGRMWRLPIVIRDRKRWVPVDAAREFLVLTSQNLIPPDRPAFICRCPRCVECEFYAMELVYDPCPPTPIPLPTIGYVEVFFRRIPTTRK